MTEAELIEHLWKQLDELGAERVDLFGLALGLLAMVCELAALVPENVWDRTPWYRGTSGLHVLDRAVELLTTEGACTDRIAGADVPSLRQRLTAVAEKGLDQ